MKRIRIVHNTEYHYRQPVALGPHRVMMRPREGHDVRIVRGRLDVEPKPTMRWLRDIDGNSIAVLTFSSRRTSFASSATWRWISATITPSPA